MNPIRFIQLACATLMLSITLVAGCDSAYGCPPQLQQFNAGHCQVQQVQQFVAPQAYVQPFVQQVYAAPQAILLPVKQQQNYSQPIRLQVNAAKPPRIAFPRAQQRQQIRQRVKQQQVQAVIQVHSY